MCLPAKLCGSPEMHEDVQRLGSSRPARRPGHRRQQGHWQGHRGSRPQRLSHVSQIEGAVEVHRQRRTSRSRGSHACLAPSEQDLSIRVMFGSGRFLERTTPRSRRLGSPPDVSCYRLRGAHLRRRLPRASSRASRTRLRRASEAETQRREGDRPNARRAGPRGLARLPGRAES